MEKNERFAIGRVSEHKFKAYMKRKGKNISETGQEYWLPIWVHEKLRFINSEDVLLMRHFPDFDTGKSLIQIKGAPKEEKYPSVTMEQASYHTAKRLSDLGIPVLIVWLYQDGISFWGQWADKITPHLSDTDRIETDGSHTPMYVIHKRELRPLDDFLDAL